MKMQFKTSFLITMVLVLATDLFAQCLSSDNIYSFVYDGKSYEIVRENKTWGEAAACAVERGGYLAEINSEEEQQTIFLKIKNNASIDPLNTTAFECDPCSFVWLGGTDVAAEGEWIWDGDLDNNGTQFWMGEVDGSPVNNAYTNWGIEPDNWNNQDGLSMGVTDWILGDQGEWNDLDLSNSLYYVIEYDIALGAAENELENGLDIFPNPTHDDLTIINRNSQLIQKIEVLTVLGQTVKMDDTFNQTAQWNISLENLAPGVYFLNLYFDNDVTLIQKVVKQ